MPLQAQIQVSAAGGVGRLLLDKPSKLNALDHDILAAIERQFAEWEAGDQVNVAVLGSTSPRAFCVGADLAVLSRMDEAAMQAWEMLGNRVLDRIERSPLLSVAAIPGHALGGGLTLAAACDFRIAAEHAAFAQPEIDLGWIPGWGGVARLARHVGASRAKELCVTARRIGTGEARTIGLLDDVAPAAELDRRVDEFAAKLAARSRPAVRAIKELAGALDPAPSPTAHRYDALVNAGLLRDPRGQAALAGFLARKSGKDAAR
jgi:enoyl-CoA hydratase